MVGGNIPNAGVLDRVEETQDLDYVVLELSNYQLRGLHLKQISPHIAVITSIYPDHLISYPTDTLEGSMQLYIQDKKAIYAYQDQDDILILKQQQDYFEDFATEAKAQIHYFSQDTLPEDWQLKLIGSHNRENLAAVYKLGKILEIDEKTIKQSLTNFSGVAHRLQVVVQHQGVTYINDTTATTPIAAQTALNSYPKGKIIWIAGGNSKNLPQKDLIETATERAKFIVLIDGDATPKLQKDLLKSTPAQKISPIHTSFKEAVREAKRNANFGDTILLSPGFTSFGMFKNEFDRGNQFMDIVAKLAK
jgi:UDP-N-acetylmuramoylalanine--D-glutamate ligase